jgi:hypothetical protein
MSTPSSSTFMLLLRGGIPNCDLSPEQLQQQIEKYMRWIDNLRGKGHFLAGEPLEEKGRVIEGKKAQTVTDGPFTESKEEVGGYFIISAKDLDAAVELSRDCPILENNGSIEVRPIHLIPGS